MTALAHEILSFANRAEASAHAGRLILGALETALADAATASLMVSGGSTPGGVFDILSRAELDWARIMVGLVDERWVSPEHEASNERLVRHRLLTGKAGAAGFLPMRTLAATAADAAWDRSEAYAPHCQPIDVILLGMGNDGHTASWFPGSSGLEAALHPSAGEVIAAIDATGCPVAGDHTERMTLTGRAVGASRTAVLLLFGDEKKNVFETALASSAEEMPIRHAIDKLGPRLTVIWAP